jgi:hypothetical protein
MISRLEVITQVAATSLLELARGVSVVEFASMAMVWVYAGDEPERVVVENSRCSEGN